MLIDLALHQLALLRSGTKGCGLGRSSVGDEIDVVFRDVDRSEFARPRLFVLPDHLPTRVMVLVINAKGDIIQCDFRFVGAFAEFSRFSGIH